MAEKTERGAGPDWPCQKCGDWNQDIRGQCRGCGRSRAESDMRLHMDFLMDQVTDERVRQISKWADCEHLPDGTGGAGRPTYETIAKNACNRAYREGRLTHAHVFEEECAEVLAAEDPAAIRGELVQVMAVCAKWIADIDSRPVPPGQPQRAKEG